MDDREWRHREESPNGQFPSDSEDGQRETLDADDPQVKQLTAELIWLAEHGGLAALEPEVDDQPVAQETNIFRRLAAGAKQWLGRVLLGRD